MLRERPRGSAVRAVVAAFVLACGDDAPSGGLPDGGAGAGAPLPDAAGVPFALGSCDERPVRPELGRWRPIPSDGGPRTIGQAFWTGSEVLVVSWVLEPSIHAYDPRADRWRQIPIPPGAPPRRDFVHLGYVSGKVFVYGGSRLEGGAVTRYRDGVLVDVRTGAGTPIATANAPELAGPYPWAPVVFAAGDRALVLGRRDGAAADALGVYDTAKGAWVATLAAREAPATFGCYHAAWNGKTAVCSNFGEVHAVTLDPPRVERWPSPPIGGGVKSEINVVWAGDRVVAWGGPDELGPGVAYAGATFDPGTRTWTRLGSAPREPRAMPVFGALGGRVLLWGGNARRALEAGGGRSEGAIFDPATGAWTATSCAGAPRTGLNFVSALVADGRLALLTPTGGYLLEL